MAAAEVHHVLDAQGDRHLGGHRRALAHLAGEDRPVLELLAARSRLVLACAIARVGQPVDGPWLVVGDEEGLAASAAHARRLGFGGKAAIHPAQLPAIRAAFAPTADEIGWARRVVAAFDVARRDGVGAVQLDDGTFIDVPVAERARSILRASETGDGA